MGKRIKKYPTGRRAKEKRNWATSKPAKGTRKPRVAKPAKGAKAKAPAAPAKQRLAEDLEEEVFVGEEGPAEDAGDEGGEGTEIGEGFAAQVLDPEGSLDDALFEGQQEPDEEEPEEPDLLERDPEAKPPVVAIVGRPNVGKSTLLNALSGSRISIVEPTPGVTRDRVGVLCTLADRTVELVDTGGVGIVDHAGLERDVEAQVAIAVEQAAVILFVLDAREGRTTLDGRVATMLRRVASRVIPVANKAESERVTWNVGEFEGLGFGTPRVISAQERTGLEALEDDIAARLPAGPTTLRHLPPPEMKLAVVGRVNAGKSSLVNALLKQERMIVSSVPGTTRETVDIRFEKDGKSFVVIDTAGIRKERMVQGGIEFYAQRRAERAMRRADVTALVLDATQDVGRLDRQIAGYAVEQAHPVLIVVNKWDLRPPDLATGTFGKYVRATLSGMTYAPIVFTTAIKGRNVDVVIDVARGLYRQATTRVTTANLNEALQLATQLKNPRPRNGRVGHVYYGTQVSSHPPTFVLFVNDPDLFDSTYRRYLENRFREVLPLREVPLRIFFKARERSPAKSGPRPV